MLYSIQNRTSGASRLGLLLIALAIAGVPIACGGDEPEDMQAAVDRELDLAMAGDSGSADIADVETAPEQPPAQDPPAQDLSVQDRRAEEPQDDRPSRDPAPTPAPDPGPGFEELTIASGMQATLTLDQTLSTEHAAVGDLFTATLETPLTDDRSVIAPAGSRVRGTVTAVQKSGGAGKEAVLKVHFEEIVIDGEAYPIQATLLEANPTLEGTRTTGERVGAGAAGAGAGALIGAIIGDGTGAIIGAAAGAAAGTAISMGTEDKNAVLAEGSEIVIRLDAPVVVRHEM